MAKPEDVTVKFGETIIEGFAKADTIYIGSKLRALWIGEPCDGEVFEVDRFINEIQRGECRARLSFVVPGPEDSDRRVGVAFIVGEPDPLRIREDLERCRAANCIDETWRSPSVDPVGPKLTLEQIYPITRGKTDRELEEMGFDKRERRTKYTMLATIEVETTDADPRRVREHLKDMLEYGFDNGPSITFPGWAPGEQPKPHDGRAMIKSTLVGLRFFGAGEGHRLLQEGEEIKAGDEYSSDGLVWHPVMGASTIGTPWTNNRLPYRRRLRNE